MRLRPSTELRVLLMAAILLVATTVEAAEPWSRADLALGATALTLSAVDWRQTVHIARNPDKFSEGANWMLPEHPSEDQVHLYFALRTVAVFTAAHYLRGPWRKAILAGASTLSIVCVEKNLSIGIAVRW